MDAAYYEELAGRLYGLPIGLLIGLDDRIGREQAQWLHHIIDVGEICVTSLPTARELVRSGRARPVDSSDMALLLSMGPRATLRRQR